MLDEMILNKMGNTCHKFTLLIWKGILLHFSNSCILWTLALVFCSRRDEVHKSFIIISVLAGCYVYSDINSFAYFLESTFFKHKKNMKT